MEPPHRPQKKWGQNFLRNEGAVRRIVEAVGPVHDVAVIEIGPGEGALTRALSQAGADLTVIEIDPVLAERLQREFAPAVRVVHADALTFPLPSCPFVAVGSLPYNVGTPILRRVIAAPHFRRAVFMLQKEVADRVVAKPGDHAYGYLTLYVKLFSTVRILMTLEPGSFRPPPKVRSAVVVLEHSEPVLQSDRQRLVALLSASFRMRRKTLTNNLSEPLEIPKKVLEARLEAIGLSADVRGETMTLSDFDRLAASIEPDAVARLLQSARPSALL